MCILVPLWTCTGVEAWAGVIFDEMVPLSGEMFNSSWVIKKLFLYRKDELYQVDQENLSYAKLPAYLINKLSRFLITVISRALGID